MAVARMQALDEGAHGERVENFGGRLALTH
jgi:hypothetical protein